jgi:hypothetical protein
VHGAAMPLAEQLPADLADLCYRNAVELTHARWDSDVEILANALRPYISKNESLDTQTSLPVDRPAGKILASEKPAVSDQAKPRAVEPTKSASLSKGAWLLISLLPLVAIGAYMFKSFTTSSISEEVPKSEVTVEYMSRKTGLPFEKIKQSLKDFKVIEKRDYFNEKTQINALYYGSKVPLNYVKEIAKTLNSAGFEIKGIQPYCIKQQDDPDFSSKVQVVHDADYIEYPILTSRKINNSNFDEKLCPRLLYSK